MTLSFKTRMWVTQNVTLESVMILANLPVSVYILVFNLIGG